MQAEHHLRKRPRAAPSLDRDPKSQQAKRNPRARRPGQIAVNDGQPWARPDDRGRVDDRVPPGEGRASTSARRRSCRGNSPMSAPAMKPPGLPRAQPPRLSAARRSKVASHVVELGEKTSSDRTLALLARLCRGTSQADAGCHRAASFQFPPVALPRALIRQADRAPDCAAPRTSQTLPMAPSLHRLDQQSRRPARRRCNSVAMPCLDAQPFHRVDQMQHDTVCRWAPTGWPRPDRRPPSTLSLSRSMRPAAPLESQRLATERLVLPGGEGRPATCAANASLSSHSPMSPRREPMAAQDRGWRTGPGLGP